MNYIMWYQNIGKLKWKIYANRGLRDRNYDLFEQTFPKIEWHIDHFFIEQLTPFDY